MANICEPGSRLPADGISWGYDVGLPSPRNCEKCISVLYKAPSLCFVIAARMDGDTREEAGTDASSQLSEGTNLDLGRPGPWTVRHRSLVV